MMTLRRWLADNLGLPPWLILAPVGTLAAAWLPHRGPKMYYNFLLRPLIRQMFPCMDPFVTIDISGERDCSMDRAKFCDAYEEVRAYLSPACAREAMELKGVGAAEGDSFVLIPREGQEVQDEFRGVTMRWASVRPSNHDREHCIRLTFHQHHRELAINEYLPHVRRCGREAMFANRRRRLYTNKKSIDYSNKVWSYIDFDHPTTFESLAMHPEKKRKIMDDLDDFRNSKDYYRRIGKVWKRGYLLYGPPGTGKSSMIAAMANYLNYDIYDIELTTVPSNNDLRKLFIETKGKSIIVIEDIDCSLDLTGQRNSAATIMAVAGAKRKRRTSRMTLSGLLNFTDGIWSAHGGERIIVFTTNFVDKLDPALIRCGRMDMHIEMSYCSFEAFMTLAKNYLDVDTHPLFGTVEKLLQMVEITPANVAECLMMSNCTERCADLCLGHLIDELKKRVQEKEMDMKRAEEEQAASAAAGGDAKPNGGEDMANVRRMIDPKIIRRVRKHTRKGEGEVTAKPNGNDSSSSDHGDNAKVVDVDTETNATDANNGDMNDSGDEDYDNYSDDDMDDYDDDDEYDDDEYDDDDDEYDDDEDD